MKKFGFSALFVALTFVQVGCGETAETPAPAPTTPPMTAPVTPGDGAAPAAEGETPAPAAEGEAPAETPAP